MKTTRVAACKKELLTGLRTVEGQVRGIAKMVEADRYCVDILVQLAAVRAQVNKIGLTILESHTNGCVSRAVKEGDGDDSIKELMDTISKFIK